MPLSAVKTNQSSSIIVSKRKHGNVSNAIRKLLSLRFLLVVVVICGSFSTDAFQSCPPVPRRYPIHTSTMRFCATTNAVIGVSLEDYLDKQIEKECIDKNLGSVLVGVAQSCAEVSKLLQRHTLDYNNDNNSHDNESNQVVTTSVNVQGEEQKKMDVVANDVFVRTLGSIESVVAMASEEEESILYTHNHTPSDKGYEIAFDPLDGSGNLDVNLPTGSIFGIAESATDPFCRPGTSLVASGYALYSSSTELILSLGRDHPDGVLGFTLVHTSTAKSTFRLSRTNMVCPSHGPYYSLNEAREPDWPNGLQQWIHDAKRGQTTTGQTYSSRYVCSLCADVHRTLLQGGWAGNPRPHLRLLYEAAPLAFVVEAAGGRGTDGQSRLLEVVPQGLHDRVCVFLGSEEDIADLQAYGDIQQVQTKQYKA